MDEAVTAPSTRERYLDRGDVNVVGEQHTLVPLGFTDWPAAASLLHRFADEAKRISMIVPDHRCGDVDFLEIEQDVRLLAERFQNETSR